MTRRTRHRNATGSRPGFSDELLYEYLVSDRNAPLVNSIAMLKDGSLLAGFFFEGVDLEAASRREKQFVRNTVNEAFLALDGTFMLHVDGMRRRHHEYIGGTFADPIDQIIDEARQERAVVWMTHTALWVTYHPSFLQRSAAGQQLMQFLTGREVERALSLLMCQIRHFEKVLTDVEERLGRLFPIRRMHSSRKNCELLQTLNYVINGILRPCPPPAGGRYLDTYLAYGLFDESVVLHHAGQYVALVSLLQYPTLQDDNGQELGLGTTVGLLEPLNKLEIEYRINHRFIALDYQGADTLFGKYRKAWKRLTKSFTAQVMDDPNAPIDNDAEERVHEVDRAKSDLNRGQKLFGYHTCVVVVRDEDKDRALANAKLVIKAFTAVGIKAELEELNGLETFKGTMPGHGYENVRKPVINTVNLADLLPLALEWGGELTSPNPRLPKGSPPLFQGYTLTGAAFRCNLHLPTGLGHALVLGPARTGKSTLLALVGSSVGRYPGARCFAIDVGNSMEALALAHRGGRHYKLGSPDGPQLTPLARLETKRDRDDAAQFVTTLFRALGLRINAEEEASIRTAVEILAANTEHAEQRTLTCFLAELQDATLKQALRYYTSGAGSRVLNGKGQSLEESAFTVFEVGDLLGFDEGKVAIPTLVHLFAQIRKAANGVDMICVVLDEAIFALGRIPELTPIVQDFLERLPKLNVFVVIATQSLEHIRSSPIRHVLLESCKTRILLANPEAVGAQSSIYAEELQLSGEEMEQVASCEAYRDYYYCGPRKRRFRLNLSPVELAFVGAGSSKELIRIRELYAQYGDEEWQARWLEERGLPSWAARYRELVEARRCAA